MLTFDDDGRTPNNRLPVLLYRPAWSPDAGEALALQLEALFNANDWPAQWRGGVFAFHHYHSLSHEVLGIFQGSAMLMLGGESGERVTVSAGEVVVLPAGVGHCRLEASDDFTLTAGYPPGQQDWDLCRSGEADITAARQRIDRVGRPLSDPLMGPDDGLVHYWH
ncbi:cupin [Kushneria phosphatilytica]|nr:cupin [Kushneria phosphatilytica]